MPQTRNAHYMLRRTLSIWKPEETIGEALDYCRENLVGEVIWKIEPEDFSHGHPSLDVIREYLPWLVRAREALAEHGILSSINPWVTLNHADRGRNQRETYPDWQWMVDASGTEASACACPLCEGFRAWLAEAYRLYATTRPHVLWLEDDLRTHGHEPVEWGCYCKLHMQALGRRLEKPMEREELVERLLHPGKPDPVRPVWFQVLGESMVGLVHAVAQSVRREHSDIHLGHMCSLAIDGSWWQDCSKELEACAEPLARPGLGPYIEGRPADLVLDNLSFCRQARCLPPDMRLAPELENFPYTPYAKSARVTRLLLGISQFLGAADVTMNLYDHVGTSLRKQDRYGKMLRDTKPILDALASRCGSGGTPRGVGVPFRPNVREYIHLKKGDYFDRLAGDGEGWAAPVQGAGFPAIWDDGASLMGLTGQTIRGYADKEIRSILSQGLLLDASALAVLQEMGYSDLLGARAGEWISKIDRPLSAEEFHDTDMGGSPGTYLSLTHLVPNERLNLIEPFAASRVISHCVDPDRRRVLPCFTLFENELGGRVAVYPFDGSRGFNTVFMNWTRKEQLGAVLRWLGRGKVDLQVDGGAWMIPFRRDYAPCIFVGVANLELDDWERLSIRLSWPEERSLGTVRTVDPAGRWIEMERGLCALEDGHLHLEIVQGLSALDFLALLIEFG